MKKVLSFVLVLCLAIGMMHFALSEDWPESSLYEGIDVSKPMSVSIYYVGFECNDWGKIEDMVNERLAQKINTTIDFVHISFADFISNYALYLSSNDVDLIYCMTPNNFAGNVANDAFIELTEDFIKTYMPQTWAKTDPALWNDVKFNGKIYAIPANDTDNNQTGVGVSANMLQKYGYTKDSIKSLDDLTEFAKKAAEGEKGTGIYGINCQNTWPSDAVYVPYMANAFQVGAGTPQWFLWRYNEHEAFDVDDLEWYADTEEFKTWALMMADYYASGIYPASVSTNSKTLDDSIHDGSTFMIPGLMPIQVPNYAPYFEERGDELVFIDCMTGENGQYLKVFNGQRAVFPYNGNPEKRGRTAMVLDLLKFDPEIHSLIVGGIEGEHYVLNADGSRSAGEKVADYTWANRFYFVTDDNDPIAQLPADVQTIVNDFDTRTFGGEKFPVVSFLYDDSNYQAELAVMNSIMSENRFAFCLGLYGDKTAEKVDEYRAMMHAAGIDDVLADYKTQFKAQSGE